jgi:hypothetical protein
MSKLTKDIIERIFWTAVQAFLAVFIVSDISNLKAAGVAAAAAVLSAIKGLVASKVGNPESASTVV